LSIFSKIDIEMIHQDSYFYDLNKKINLTKRDWEFYFWWSWK